MDFDYCEEYLTSISNNMLSWQCLEKQILIQLTFQILWFFDKRFLDARAILFDCDYFCRVLIWLVALKVFLERVTIYFHGLPYPLPLRLPKF